MPVYPDPPDRYGRADVPAARQSGALRQVSGSRLWAGGVATAVVAALIALVGVLVVRALLRIDVYAPHTAGAFGNSNTVLLCLTAAVAALGATAVIHLLILSTPRPFAYFSWIVGLLTTAAVVMPFTYGSNIAVAVAQALIHLVIGMAIGSLVSGAGSSAIRTAVMAPPRPDGR
jgi:hypothetical protein